MNHMNQFYNPAPPTNHSPAPSAAPAHQAYPTYYPPQPTYPQPVQAVPYYISAGYPAPSFAVQRKDPRKVRARFTLNRAAAIVLLQVTASVLLQLLLTQIFLFAGIDVRTDTLSLTLMSGVMAPVCTAGPALIYMFAYKGSWGDFLRFEKTGFFTGFLWVLAGLGLSIAGNYPAAVLETLLEMLGANDSFAVIGQGDTWGRFALDFFLVAILVPVVEEFAFRGVIFSALRPFGQGFAIVGSALIFGLAHLTLYSVVFATIAGLGMAIAYAKTRNLWITVFIHIANNGLAVLGSYAKLLPLNSWMQTLFQALLTLAPLFLGAIAFVILLIIGHLRKQRTRAAYAQPQPAPMTLPPLRGGETVACILSTPLIWAVFVLALLDTAVLFL